MNEMNRWMRVGYMVTALQLVAAGVGAQSGDATTAEAPSAEILAEASPGASEVNRPTAKEALKPEGTGDPAKRPDIREADANADRVVLLPTAETHPKGRMYFSAHELLFWQLGYAFTDRIQATVTTWPVIVKDQPFFIDGSLKANLFRSNVARLALAGGITYVSSPVDGANDTASVGRIAAIGQLCLTESCWTSLVGGLSAWVPLSDAKGSLYAGGLGVTAKLSRHVGLLLEFDTGAVFDNSLKFAEGGLVNYGVRFSGNNIGVDLALIKPTFGEDDLVMGIPWLSFTYRSDPLTL